MTSDQIISSIGVIITAMLGVGGVIFAIARGFFNINVSLRELTEDTKEIKVDFKDMVGRVDRGLEETKGRLDAMDWLNKDFERRLTTIEAGQKVRDQASSQRVP